MNSLRSNIFFSDPFCLPLNGNDFLCGIQGQRQTALPAEFAWVYIASLAQFFIEFFGGGEMLFDHEISTSAVILRYAAMRLLRTNGFL